MSQKPVGNSGKVTTTAGGNCLPGTTRKESTRMAMDGCGTHGSNEEKSDKCITTGVEVTPYFDLKVIASVPPTEWDEEEQEDTEDENQVDRNKGKETGRAT